MVAAVAVLVVVVVAFALDAVVDAALVEVAAAPNVATITFVGSVT